MYVPPVSGIGGRGEGWGKPARHPQELGGEGFTAARCWLVGRGYGCIRSGSAGYVARLKFAHGRAQVAIMLLHFFNLVVVER